MRDMTNGNACEKYFDPHCDKCLLPVCICISLHTAPRPQSRTASGLVQLLGFKIDRERFWAVHHRGKSPVPGLHLQVLHVWYCGEHAAFWYGSLPPCEPIL